MRRLVIYGFLLALTGTALLCRGWIEETAARVVTRRAARQALAAWGLPPSRENVALYLAMGGYRPDFREEAIRFIAESPPPPTRPASVRFSDRWTYAAVLADHPVTVGVYDPDPSVADFLDRISRFDPANPDRWFVVRWLKTRDDLVRSFAQDAFVLYFGHANAGRGIAFTGPDAEAPLPMGPDTLEVPRTQLTAADEVLEDLGNGFVRIPGGSQGLDTLAVGCKVFGYFGCRTDRYFRDTWQSRFPQVDFIGTTYACHTMDMAPEILLKLARGLHAGRSLGEIVDDLNRDQAAAILFGRMKETTLYRNSSAHAEQLFTY